MITIQFDANGNVIAAFQSTKSFNCITISAPELKQGGTYTLYKNATVSNLDENGFEFIYLQKIEKE